MSGPVPMPASAPVIAFSRRLRRTPFSAAVEEAGVTAYTVYNQMLLATAFASLEEDYRHLKENVQLWDVSCERQVQLTGPDAGRLMQLLTPRNMSKMQDDQCYYVPVVDYHGGMLNDPVALRVDEDRWWISLSDSGFLYWVKGLATGLDWDVVASEPDVSPLAVQGPKADTLMARVFGEAVNDIGFFRHKRCDFEGKTFVVARSGYSKQGGYEIYVEGTRHAMPLWHALSEAGRDLDVRAGCPNLIERIEGGLLSYGNDMTLQNTPFECGLGKFCHIDDDIDCIGKSALQLRREPGQQICPMEIDGGKITPPRQAWPLFQGDEQVGQLTSAAWSPDFGTVVAIGMVNNDNRQAGNVLVVHTPHGHRHVTIKEEFWI